MTIVWQSSTSPLVRELGWSLFSPAVAAFSVDGTEAPWEISRDEEAQYLLDALAANPAPLSACLSMLPDRRLGARFEALWRYFFDHHSFYQVLAANLQINVNGRTLGALDFLLEDGFSQHIIHLELAVKFYLYFPPSGPVDSVDLSQWIGPNPDDNLQLKLDHLRYHQLPLSEDPVVEAVLKGKGLPLPHRRAAMVKGYLFLPWGDEAQIPNLEEAADIQRGCLRGWWLYDHQLWLLEDRYGQCQWGSLEKHQWLDPMPPLLFNFKEINDRVAEHFSSANAFGMPQPLMLAAGDAADRDHCCERFFVMPPSWPYSIRAKSD